MSDEPHETVQSPGRRARLFGREDLFSVVDGKIDNFNQLSFVLEATSGALAHLVGHLKVAKS